MLFMNFSSESADSIKTKYQEVAKQHKGDGLLFLLGDVEARQGALQNTDGEKHSKAILDSNQIAPWVKEYKEGKVPLYKKFEHIPEVNNEVVKVVVANSLDDMVTKSRKNGLMAALGKRDDVESEDGYSECVSLPCFNVGFGFTFLGLLVVVMIKWVGPFSMDKISFDGYL